MFLNLFILYSYYNLIFIYKKAADLYFDEKQSGINTNIDENLIKNQSNDFKIFVEDVIIPKKLKIKTKGHKKIITSMKFNSFGTNFITTGDDNFLKIWDATKRKKK